MSLSGPNSGATTTPDRACPGVSAGVSGAFQTGKLTGLMASGHSECNQGIEVVSQLAAGQYGENDDRPMGNVRR
jgi:hypothetical protein